MLSDNLKKIMIKKLVEKDIKDNDFKNKINYLYNLLPDEKILSEYKKSFKKVGGLIKSKLTEEEKKEIIQNALVKSP